MTFSFLRLHLIAYPTNSGEMYLTNEKSLAQCATGRIYKLLTTLD
jgi:hypothetical protein